MVFKPVWEQVASQLRSKVDFQTIDADNDRDTPAKYNVKSYPHVIYLDGSGRVLSETSYYQSADEFKRAISQYVQL